MCIDAATDQNANKEGIVSMYPCHGQGGNQVHYNKHFLARYLLPLFTDIYITMSFFDLMGDYSVFSECMLRHGVLHVFVSFCVLELGRAILSWCP